jgi:hypothetical protein
VVRDGDGKRFTRIHQEPHAKTTQVGIPLELDIGVIDVNTCEPMEDVLISLWVCPIRYPCESVVLTIASTATQPALTAPSPVTTLTSRLEISLPRRTSPSTAPSAKTSVYVASQTQKYSHPSCMLWLILF